MIKTKLPVLFIKNHEIFPYCETKIEFRDLKLKQTISLAENLYDNCLIIVHQKNNDNFESINNINIGILAKITFKIEMPNGNMRISLKGIKRSYIDNILSDEDIYEANLTVIEKEDIDPIEEIAMSRKLKKSLEQYVKLTDNDIIDSIKDIHDIEKLTDIVVNLLELDHNRKLKYLKEIRPIKRLEMLLDDIEYEKSILAIEEELELKVNHELENSQKEFYLKEKLNIIKAELGENESEYIEIEKSIKKLDAPSSIKKRLEMELNRYKSCNSNSPEIGIIRNYIDILLDLPWNKSSKEEFNAGKVREALENTHFGLLETKERIIEHIMVRHFSNHKNLPILCLVGPPGVGKTSIATSIAEALKLKCVKISVGGVNDEAEIIGHRRTYVGAAPGKIMSSIRKIGVNNPVFIIDEVDKMTKDIKGDPASALLEVLDKEQNNKFVDHFIDEEFDLSKVMFILTANYLDKIPEELKDRMEIINISSYTEYEKIKIAKNYIIPKLIKDYRVKLDFEFLKETYIKIIRCYTKESGVREFTRVLDKIIRKYICYQVENKEFPNPNEDLEHYLGIIKYQNTLNTLNSKGVITGLAYTPYGGEIVKVETICYPGTGIKVTGQVGDIMEESINVALGYIKGNYQNFNLDINFLNNNVFHLHLPSNAIKKDGTSAGITIVTSIISYLKNKEISNRISMSGEITLTGKILKVGGIKEKIIAAINNNVEIVFLPVGNKEEVSEISYIYNNKLRVVFVSNYSEIYNILFSKS